MRRDIHESDYAALAELRYRIREFLRGGDQTAEAAGLEPQHYQLLLALRALPHQSDATIRRLAEKLYLKHHSVVGLVDRLEAHGYVRRFRNVRDQREVLVMLLPRGRKALEQVVQKRLHELSKTGYALVESISTILRRNRATRDRPLKISYEKKSRLAKHTSRPLGPSRRKASRA